ncbi:hypothetical protein D3C85_757640 [compost metagenome]
MMLCGALLLTVPLGEPYCHLAGCAGYQGYLSADSENQPRRTPLLLALDWLERRFPETKR